MAAEATPETLPTTGGEASTWPLIGAALFAAALVGAEALRRSARKGA
mgnify:CR=1 FL=1